jgi:hypothetical protein
MKIIEHLNRLDSLIVENTVPPATSKLRNYLSAIIEQGETEGDLPEAIARAEAQHAQTLAALRQEIAALQSENAPLRSQLKNPALIVKLDEEARRALQFLCDRNNVVTIRELAGFLACQESKAQFVCDSLIEKGLILLTSLSNIDPRFDALSDISGYEITSDGRKLCFENAAHSRGQALKAE